MYTGSVNSAKSAAQMPTMDKSEIQPGRLYCSLSLPGYTVKVTEISGQKVTFKTEGGARPGMPHDSSLGRFAATFEPQP